MAKPALSYLPETSEEARQANTAYQQALDRLTKTLDARKNQFLDPTMMALMQGFLTPGKTGSFGESLGTAVGLASKAQEEELAKDVEIAKAQMDLAQSGVAMQRQRGLDQTYADFMRNKANAPQAGRPGGVQPGLGGAPDISRGGIPWTDPDPSIVSEEEYVASQRGSGKTLGEVRADYQSKYGKDRFRDIQGIGTWDRMTGTLFPAPGRAPIKKQIITGPNGESKEYEVDPVIAVQLDQAMMSGDLEKYSDLASRVTGENLRSKIVKSQPAKSTSAPQVSDEPAPESKRGAPRAGGFKSQSTLEAEKRAETVRAEERTRAQEESRKAIMEKASAARDQIMLADEFKSFGSRADASDIFGRASQSTIANLVQLLQAGISMPGGSVGLAGFEDFYRNENLTPDQRAAAQRFVQLSTQMQLMMSQYVKGAVSNYEQVLFGKSGINIDDLPKTIRLKAEALRTRAEFDRAVGDLLSKNPELNTENIKNTHEYKMAEARLNERYRNIIMRYQDNFKDKSVVDAAKNNRPEDLVQQKPKSLGAPGGIFDQLQKKQESMQSQSQQRPR